MKRSFKPCALTYVIPYEELFGEKFTGFVSVLEDQFNGLTKTVIATQKFGHVFL